MPAAGVLTPEFADFPQGTELGYMIDNNADTKFIIPHSNFYIMWSGVNRPLPIIILFSVSRRFTGKRPQIMDALWFERQRRVGGNRYSEEPGIFGTKGKKKEFLLNNKEYLYYKLEVTENGGSNTTQIAEWNLHGYTDVSRILERSEGSTFSSITPMGKHFENRPETTDEVRTWLRALLPTNRPSPMVTADFNGWNIR